jgi:type IV secretion system protein VirB11
MTAIELAEDEKQKRLLNNLFTDMKDLIPYLEDKAVTDISVEDTGEIIVSKFGEGRIFTGKILQPVVTQRIILAAASIIGRKLDMSSGFPKLEGTIPKYNARITGLIQPNVIRPELQLRRPPEIIYPLEDYLKQNIINNDQYGLIINIIKDQKNIIISGSTGSGKTTFLNAVIKKMEEFTPGANFYIVEDVPELQCLARMRTKIWIDTLLADQAVMEALRWSPDHIIFGEIRNRPVMQALYTLFNTGHRGCASTVHANTAASTLTRLQNLLGDKEARLCDVIQYVIHLTKTSEGIKVDEIMPVTEDTDDFLASINQSKLG